MENYGVYLPQYTIGDGNVYEAIPTVCKSYGKTACVIGGETALKKAGDAIKAGAGDAITLTGFIPYGGDSCECNIEALYQNETVREADMIFAVGGGRAVDTCKVVGDRLDKPVFTFPTIASNCAPITKVCVVYHDDHSMKGLYWAQRPPIHTFINTKIIGEAPIEYLWAGIGDALSKQYESTFKARGKALNHSNRLGVDIASHCAADLLKHGKKALSDCKAGIVGDDLALVILTIIINTGLVSVLVDNVYNSALAHSFYYGCTHFPHIEKNHLHGELVAYGILLLLAMDEQTEAFEEVYAFNQSVNLPTSYTQVELAPEHFDELIAATLATGDVVDSPYEITKERILKAFDVIESYQK